MFSASFWSIAVILGSLLSAQARADDCALLLCSSPYFCVNQVFCPARSPASTLVNGLGPNGLTKAAAYTGGPTGGSTWLFGNYVPRGDDTTAINRIDAHSKPFTTNVLGVKLTANVQGHTATVVNDSIFVCGGRTIHGLSNVCDVFTPSGNNLVAAGNIPTMPMAVQEHVAVALEANNKAALVITAGNVNAATMVYDPIARVWSVKSPIPTQHHTAGAAVAFNSSTLLYCGGYNSNDKTTSNQCFFYDLASDAWTPAARLTTARTNHAMLKLNGVIYAIGGTVTGFPVKTIEYFDANTHTFQLLAGELTDVAVDAASAAVPNVQ